MIKRLAVVASACAMGAVFGTSAEARQITSIRLESTITVPSERWIQIAELTAEANGVNVAAASEGGVATSDSVYSPGYDATKANDGVIQPGNMYHSRNSEGDHITITFARRSDVTRITYYGRHDCCQNRDILRYTLYDGANVVGSGILDASQTRVVVLDLEGSPTPPVWSTGAWSAWSTSCGTATRTRTVQCTSPDTGAALPDANCTAQRPEASESSEQTSGCTYAWETAGYGAWGACQAGVERRMVSVECRRNDGASAADANCTEARPDVQETRSCAMVAPTPTPPAAGGADVVVFRRPLGQARK